MEKLIKFMFKIIFFCSVFFYKNSGELLIVFSLTYFPCIYLASFFDAYIKKLETLNNISR